MATSTTGLMNAVGRVGSELNALSPKPDEVYNLLRRAMNCAYSCRS